MNPARQLRISAWAIQNPTPVAVLFIALVLAGMISYLTLPVKNYPNIEFPVAIVTVTQSGAAPQELKTQVTRQIDPPAVTRFDFDDQPIITYAVTPAPGVNMSASDLSWIVDNDLSRTLQG